MDALPYEFRSCTNPGCGLRYPRLPLAQPEQVCPRCGANAVITARGAVPPEDLEREPGPRLPLAALLENIRSAWNVGAMFRTADGIGLAGLHLCGITPTPAHPQVVKTALGAERSVPWDYHPDALTRAAQLKAGGWRLWALEVDPAAAALETLAAHVEGSPLVLVIGNELTGIDPALQALCERTVIIPMRGVKRSLNAAVAFGMALHWLRAELGR